LVPISVNKNRNPNALGEVNKDVMYQNLVVDFKWGHMEEEGVLVDYYTRRTFANNSRVQFSVLADAYVEDFEFNEQKLNFLEKILSQNGGTPTDSIQTPIGMFIRGEIPSEIDKAKALMEESKTKTVEVLDKAFEIMPNNKVPFARIIPYYITAYYAVGEMEKGNQYANQVLDLYAEELDYYLSVDPEFSGSMMQEMFGVYRSMFTIFQTTAGGEDEAISARSYEMVTNYMNEIKKIKFPKHYRGAYDQTCGGFFTQIEGFLMQPQ